MDSFTKSLKIKFEPDEVSYRQIEKDINNFHSTGLFSKKEIDEAEKQLKRLSDLKTQLALNEDMRSKLVDVHTEASERVQKQLNEDALTIQREIVLMTNNSQKDFTKDINATISKLNNVTFFSDEDSKSLTESLRKVFTLNSDIDELNAAIESISGVDSEEANKLRHDLEEKLAAKQAEQFDLTISEDVENALSDIRKVSFLSNEDEDILKDELKQFENLKNQIIDIESAIEALSGIDNDVANKQRKKLEKELEALKKTKARKETKTQTIDKRQLAKDITNVVSDNFKTFGNELKSSNSEFAKILGNFSNGFGETINTLTKLFSGDLDSLNDILNSAIQGVASLLADGFDELDNLLDFSRLSNKNTRDLMFQYGFSNQEAYGYSKAMDVMGFESEEDLMYAAQNPEEMAMFREAFNKYSDKYNQLYDSGTFEQMRQFDVEMAEFKEDLKLEVVNFFMNNKDTIKSAMKWLISLAEFTIDALGKFVKWLNPDAKTSNSQKAANTASIISNYSNVNSSTNVSIDNTFNNVNKEDQRFLANAGQMTYEQVIKALS